MLLSKQTNLNPKQRKVLLEFVLCFDETDIIELIFDLQCGVSFLCYFC